MTVRMPDVHSSRGECRERPMATLGPVVLSGAAWGSLGFPQPRDPNYLAFAKTMERKELLAQVDQVLKKGHASGAIQRLIDKHIASLE